MSDIKTDVQFSNNMRDAILGNPVVQAELEMHANPRLASIRGVDSRAFVKGYQPADTPVRTQEIFHAKKTGKLQPKSSEGKSQPHAAWIVVHEDELPAVLRAVKSIQRDYGFPIVEKGAFDKGHSFEKDNKGYVTIPMFANFNEKEKSRIEAKGGHVTLTTKSDIRRVIPATRGRRNQAAEFDMD